MESRPGRWFWSRFASAPMSFLSSVDGFTGSTRKTGQELRPRFWPDFKREKAHNRMKQALLLDDNAAQLLVRELVLRNAQIDSHVATKAKSALALLRTAAGRNKIGVVITDHIMPDMDGVAFVKELRTFNREVPVIVISGLPDADTEYAGLDVIFR